MDESGFGLDFPLHACWMKRGSQTRLPTTPEHKQSSYLIGAYEWSSDQLIALRRDRLNAQSMLDFFEYLIVEVFPHDPLVIVLDNAAFHSSTALRAFFALVEARVHLEYLPKYSPDLNPIERVWGHFKRRVCANHLFASLDLLFAALSSAIRLQNDPSYPHRLLFSKDF